MVVFGISIIIRHVLGPPPLHPHDPLKPTFFVLCLCPFRLNMFPLPEIGHKDRKIPNDRYPKRYFL